MRKAGRWIVLISIAMLSAVPYALVSQAPPGVSARTLYAQGRDAQTDLDYYRAVELYIQSLKLNPSYIEPMIGLSECYRMLDEYEEALTFITKARKFAAGRTDLVNLEARIRMGMGEMDAASRLFSSVLGKEPFNIDARLGLAELSIAAGKLDSAEKKYLEILTTARSDRKTLLSLFLLYDTLGNLEAAERYLDMSLRYHADDPQVHYLAGLFYTRINNLGKAAKEASTVLSLDSDYPGAVLLAGKIALRRGDAGEAERFIRDYLRKNANESEAWFILAQALIAKDDISGGILAFERAIRLSPDEEILRLALENAVIKHLPLEDSRRTAYGAVRFSRGKTLEERNFFDQAEDEYRRGLMLSPYSKDGRLLYAEILRKNGNTVRYASELNLIRELGNADIAVNEKIERAAGLLRDSILVRWKIDPESLNRQRYRTAVFFTPESNRSPWNDADTIAASYITDLLAAYNNLTILPGYPRAGSYADAFRTARAAGADYFFLITGFYDDGIDSEITADLYLARTGTKTASLQANGSGVGRIYRVSSTLAGDTAAVLPVRGSIFARDFERALVDIGTGTGLAKGKKLLILKKNTLELRTDAPGFLYPADAVIGEISIENSDELVSEGIIAKRGFFDHVKPGDTVIFENTGRDKVQEKTSISPGLFRRILQVR